MNRCKPAPFRWLSCAIASILLGAPAAAQTTLSVTADSHVTDNVTDRIPNHYNFGAMPYLLAQNDPIRAYKIYLRFDLSEIAKSASKTVTNASLRLNFSRFREQVGDAGPKAIEANTISVYGITDNGDNWTEGALNGENSTVDLTFNNAPHNDKTDAAKVLGLGTDDGASARLIGTFSVVQDAPVGTELTVDATPFINWALRGGTYGAAPNGDTDKQVTFILVHTAGNDQVPNNGVQFFSKENTAGPEKQILPSMAPRLIYSVAPDAPPPSGGQPTRTNATTLPTSTGTITTVVDAKTLLISGVGNVRLLGVLPLKDPARKPRPDDELFGDDADRATRRLAAGSRVRVEVEGRSVGSAPGWVFLADGSLLNEQLIRRGYAKMDPAAKISRYAPRLRFAEQEARNAKRGLWAKQK
ncbi:MAG: DNRLRE domain-containing protein [Armatimonadota bacterium]